jgi:spermidine/putrescine transport system permease protein
LGLSENYRVLGLSTPKLVLKEKLFLVIRRRKIAGALLMVGIIYIVVFLILPLIYGAIYSMYGGFYTSLFTNPLFIARLIKSIKVGIEVTIVCLLLGYPVAYYLARITTLRKDKVVTLLILPLFLSFLVRTYSWYYILGTNGVINFFLMWAGLISEPISLLFTEAAVVIGLTNWSIIFMVISLYSSLERIDVNLIEQAKNLGANKLQTFREVTLPLSLPGIASGCILVFILSFGSYITPAILGGPDDLMIANLIELLFLKLFNWPLGMAATIITTIIVLVMIYLYSKLVGLDTLLKSLG